MTGWPGTIDERLLVALRPRLHRYATRMTGSVIDGEDVVQDALTRAVAAAPDAGDIVNPEGWLFRVVHNAALDLLRRRSRRKEDQPAGEIEMIADPRNETDARIAAEAGLAAFMRLPPAQRSSVILMDVLGYSLAEIGSILEVSVPAVKASLNRGRRRLRSIADEPDDTPVLSAEERRLLTSYVDRFNARDFDAVRDMLAEEVRLDLLARTSMTGRREVGTYLGNYAATEDWRLQPGFVEGRPAVLVFDRFGAATAPAYFILLQWQDGEVLAIRDFRYARHTVEAAVMHAL